MHTIYRFFTFQNGPLYIVSLVASRRSLYIYCMYTYMMTSTKKTSYITIHMGVLFRCCKINAGIYMCVLNAFHQEIVWHGCQSRQRH